MFHKLPVFRSSMLGISVDCSSFVPLFVVAVVVSDEGIVILSVECARHNQSKRKEFLRFIPND